MIPKSSPLKSVPVLKVAAQRALQSGSFKDAIAALKDLLKQERGPESEDLLAEAYLGRAREVARKVMFQEAAMLWENHATHRPGTPISEEYLSWLLKAGQMGKFGQALAAVPDDFAASASGRRLIEAAALLALENDKIPNALPKEHAIVRHRPLLRKALAAYAERRDAEAEDYLRQVSSRSPYRNLRTLLKGLLALERDPAEASEILARVDPDSACRKLAAVLREQIATPTPDLAAYLKLPPKLRAIVDKLKGYGKKELALLREIQNAAQAKSARPVLEAILRHGTELGEAESRRFCLAALVESPEAIPLYERAFGALTPLEQCRIKALHAEAIHDHPKASRYWHEYIELLKSAPEGRDEPLTQALILRHVADLAEKVVPELAIEFLEQSLELDPDDKATYLRLIGLLELFDDAKAALSWLDRAVKRYPKDPEILLPAMRAAQRRKAFKKVANYAKTLLEIDPINSDARRFLLEAHLGHARKQLKARRTDLAEAELAAARKLDPQRRSAALLWLEGLLAYWQADNERCRSLWQEAWTVAGGGAAAWFQWAIEVLAADMPLKGPDRLVQGLDKQHSADRGELMALVKLLGKYREEGRQNLSQVLHKLTPMLKPSFKQAELSEEDFFCLCQGFAAAGQYELLAECAKQAARRYRYPPVFVYFEIYAKYRGDAAGLLPLDQLRLQMNLDQAHQEGDRRTAALIEQFLRKHQEALQADFHEALPEGALGLDDEVAERFVERMEELDRLSPEERAKELLGDYPPEQLEKLSEKDVMGLILDKLLGGLGVDASRILDALPLPGRGKKSKNTKKS
ncbi:tetratricopeptide repeat protein [Methylocaldum szegediense]|uniref:tetratricopeptide repeat protein n=1 Tax=Methylocaldum szegediense TaxID=73780 RepID=UPI00040D238D|nr:tetratricopeptide repeat protein [Methylocaldum szegediense]